MALVWLAACEAAVDCPDVEPLEEEAIPSDPGEPPYDLTFEGWGYFAVGAGFNTPIPFLFVVLDEEDNAVVVFGDEEPGLTRNVLHWEFEDVLAQGVEHRIRFWIDANQSGTCDPPPGPEPWGPAFGGADQSWEFPLYEADRNDHLRSDFQPYANKMDVCETVEAILGTE